MKKIYNWIKGTNARHVGSGKKPKTAKKFTESKHITYRPKHKDPDIDISKILELQSK